MTTNPVDLESLRGHTPAPWHLSDEGFAGNGSSIPTVYATDSCLRLIAVCNDGMNPVGDETDNLANARLIAAAPDLLAELTERRARDAKVAELVRSAELAVRNIKTALRIEDDIELGTIRQLGDAQRSLAAALAAFKEPTP